MHRLVLPALTLGIVACSSDQFTNTPDAAVEDSGTADVARVDSGDASPTSDGAISDVSVDAFVPPPALDCVTPPPKAILCDAFENSAFPSPPIYQSPQNTAPVTLANKGYSPTHCASGAITASGGAEVSNLGFAYNDPGATSRYELSFAFRVVNLPPAVAVRFAAFSFLSANGPGLGQYSFVADGSIAKLIVKTGSGSTNEFALGGFTIGTWHFAKLVVDVLGIPSVSVTYDGQSSQPGMTAGLASTTDKSRNLTFGVQRSTAGLGAAVDIDDVLLVAP